MKMYNKSFHLTAIPLRSIAAGELYRSAAPEIAPRHALPGALPVCLNADPVGRNKVKKIYASE